MEDGASQHHQPNPCGWGKWSPLPSPYALDILATPDDPIDAPVTRGELGAKHRKEVGMAPNP